MSWEAVGAIGEVVGAVGVISTLLYLSLQIRNSTKATESQVHVNLSAEMETLAVAMSTNDDLADAMLVARTNGQLTDRQAVQLSSWFGGFLRVSESHFIQSRLEATTIELEAPIRNILRRHARSPVLRRQMENAVRFRTATDAFLDWLEREVLSEERERSSV